MNQTYFQQFTKQVKKFKSGKEIGEFLEAILTPAELEQIPTRLQIIKMLKKGIPQAEISAKLKTGIATVTRGSRMIKEGKFKNIWG